jgi:ATP-dependent protease ClpP protease subunit
VQIHTVGVGVAIGQSCMLLSAGAKGKRYMLPHATGAATIRNSHALNVSVVAGPANWS